MLNYAKAIVASVVGLASAWAVQKFGVDVPAEAQDWLVNIIFALVTGGVVWLVPNEPAATKKK